VSSPMDSNSPPTPSRPTLPEAARVINVVVLAIEGRVEVCRSGSQLWDRAYTNQLVLSGDRLRTGKGSRATLRLPDMSTLRVGELSTLQVPAGPERKSGLEILKGMLYFFHRDQPGDVEIQTPAARAKVRG